MADIAPIKGLIELQDDFTSQLGLAEAALGNFTKTNQESLKAVAGALGIVGAAVGAVAFATIELGKRGSDVNDLTATIEHFAGGADAAGASMKALRDGTLGTVDDFDLAKEAAHLLSAGVKLTADEFGTLGQAAFVLQNRGLGPTNEQLKLVSDALVTGRTRALAAALGVIENANAEEDYAKKLGVTKDQLSESGKVEARRIEVMRLLGAAVKDAGVQERDFGEQFEFAQAQVNNFIDELGSSIASSEVFKAAFKGIKDALKGAFDGDKQQAIKATTKFIEDGAIQVIGFAQVTIEMAKIVDNAWQAVRTIVLGVTTVVTGLVTGIVAGLELVAKAANYVGVISDETVQSLSETRQQLSAMTDSLADQTAEAAKATFTSSEFDKTLDKLSTNLGNIKANMLAAQQASKKQTEQTKEASKATVIHAASQEDLNKNMIDTTKVNAALQKSTQELAAVWADYDKMVAERSGTARDVQIKDIELAFQKQVATLDKLDPLYKQKYAAYQAIAHESLMKISSDWESVRDKSLEALEDMRDVAESTYEDMLNSGLTFSRQALDEQRKKYMDLSDQVRNYGRDVQTSVQQAADSVKILDRAWVTDADIAAQTINKTTVMVRTLSGEVISLIEAQKRQQAGFSYSVRPVDQYEIDRTPGGADALLNELRSLSQSLDTMKSSIRNQQDQNRYFEALARYNALRDAYNLLISQAKNKTPGFASGGIVGGLAWEGPGRGGDVMVGERGPEVVRLPFGSQVYPTGAMPVGQRGSGVTNINNTWHVNGTGAMVAREVSDIIMRQLKQARQFGAA